MASLPENMLFAPLMNEGEAVGIITVTRVAPGPFGEQHTRLLQMFADQAVIAIRNVGLFNEVQQRTEELSEALTYQTGSANILRVIASSPTDVKPVLKAIVESACELCEADDALVTLKDGDDLVFQEQHGSIPVVWQRQTIKRETPSGRAVIEGRSVHDHRLWRCRHQAQGAGKRRQRAFDQTDRFLAVARGDRHAAGGGELTQHGTGGLGSALPPTADITRTVAFVR